MLAQEYLPRNLAKKPDVTFLLQTRAMLRYIRAGWPSNPASNPSGCPMYGQLLAWLRPIVNVSCNQCFKGASPKVKGCSTTATLEQTL